MAKVIFSYGSQAQYNALATKDTNTIYFVTDTRRIYKGGQKVSDVSVRVVGSVPEYADALEDVLYVVITDADISLHIKDTTSQTMKQVGGGQIKDGAISTMEMFDESLIFKTTQTDEDGNEIVLQEGDDSTIPTSGAVVQAIKSELADYVGSAFVDVEASRVAADELNPAAGTVLKFKHADGVGSSEVRIADLFLTSAEYDADSHILSLTVQGQNDPVEVNLEDLVPQAVSTSNVAMSRNIVATVAVGNIKKGQTIDVSKITDLQTFLETMLSQDSLPTATQPTVTLTTANNKAYEVGTKVTPTYSATFSAGSYSQTAAGNQVASGVTTEDWTVKCTGQADQTFGSQNSVSGSFDEITVEDDTDVAVTVTVNHTAGNTPLSYLGNTEVDGTATSTKAIAKGSKSDTNNTHITSYRNCFWGYKTADTIIADPAAITVDEIKNLGNTNKTKPSSLTATGMQQMFFAVPATQANKLTIVGAAPPAPQTVNGPIEVQIGGVDNYSPIAYNVFYVSNASATSGSDTYTLTFSKE